ncbi:MAG: hypothetical protein ABSH45_08390 [Bryobacteraceae bacterium]|jgi:hypothetical protein
MEKQRDKAAKRLQRKLQRESGIPLPDDGDGLDGEIETGETETGETGAGELVKATDDHKVSPGIVAVPAGAGELVKATDEHPRNVE